MYPPFKCLPKKVKYLVKYSEININLVNRKKYFSQPSQSLPLHLSAYSYEMNTLGLNNNILNELVLQERFHKKYERSNMKLN